MMYCTSSPPESLPADLELVDDVVEAVLPVTVDKVEITEGDGVADGEVAGSSRSGAEGDDVADGEVAGSSRSGTETGTGIAALVVVLRAGAKAECSIASRLKGYIPVLRNALRMVSSVNARSRARE